MENQQGQHALDLCNIYFGLTAHDIRKLAFEFAVTNNVQNNFEQTKKNAEKDWLEDILKRRTEHVDETGISTVPDKLLKQNYLVECTTLLQQYPKRQCIRKYGNMAI